MYFTKIFRESPSSVLRSSMRNNNTHTYINLTHILFSMKCLCLFQKKLLYTINSKNNFIPPKNIFNVSNNKQNLKKE